MAGERDGMTTAGEVLPEAIAQQEPLSMVRMNRPPAAVLAEATEAATALIKVVDDKGWSMQIGKSVHLQFEAWQTCGQFYGITTRVVECNPVVLGDARGFKAKAVAVHAATGKILSAGEMYCMDDEENWGRRPKYEWRPKKGGGGDEKVQTGTIPVPMYQLASMAQTRAGSKALRQCLSWVVVLAGYNPTPAEEAGGSTAYGSDPKAEQPTQTTDLAGKTLILNLDNAGLSLTGSSTYDLKEQIKKAGGRTGKTADGSAFAWRFPVEDLAKVRALGEANGVTVSESEAVRSLDMVREEEPPPPGDDDVPF